MRTAPLFIVLAAAAAGLAACGDGGSGPSSVILDNISVSPATATVFAGPPENTYVLTVTARDADGQVIGSHPSPTFVSSNTAAATVSPGGVVAVVGAGSAEITASLTMAGVTKTAIAAVTGQMAPPALTVQAPALTFDPQAAHILAGGTVTWVIHDIPHTVDFTTGGAPASISQTTNSSISRVFPASGSFRYVCSIHAGMSGTVHVH
jgi:plastocyanin